MTMINSSVVRKPHTKDMAYIQLYLASLSEMSSILQIYLLVRLIDL